MGFRLKSLLGAAIVILGYVVVTWAVTRQYASVANAFIARHTEVSPLIDVVYQEYFKTDKWPESSESLPPDAQKLLGTGWQYVRESDDLKEPPLLLLMRGPLHMKLVYRFRKDGALASPGGWEATSEGSSWPGQFTEQIPERPQPL